MSHTPTPVRRGFGARNLRVAQKLQAILLIPVLVALVLGGVRVNRTVDTWQSAKDAVRVAELVQAANKYASDAIDERDVSVIPLVKGDRGSSTVAKARHLTDADAKEFNAAVARIPRTDGLQRRIELVRAGERQLPSVRAGAFTSRLSGVRTEESYHAVQHPLMEISNELGFGIASQATYGRTLYAVSLTQAAESLIRAIGTHLLVEDRSKLAKGELQSQIASFSSYVYLEQVALQEYAGFAGTAETARLREALADAEKKGQEQSAEARTQAEAAGKNFVPPPSLARMTGAIATGATATRLAEQGITPETFFAASTLGFDAYRSVEVYLTETALAQAHTIADDARNSAIVNAVLVLAAVLAAFLLATWVARTMSTSMRLLSTSAHEIAGQRLPATLTQLTRTVPGRVDATVEPIPITTTDEIGEVARAFDHVHREAVRLAAEQALLRANINTILSNLARRNQSLIEGQLSMITQLEDREADPDQLENLFQLDHLATRVRRNGENLLVLSGEAPVQQWDQPTPLVDVLRAAVSEVEQYERIQLSGVPEIQIDGRAVNDLVHLLAELLENATTFSSPHAPVDVTAARLPDGRIMLEIHDQGIGLPPEEVAEVNRDLVEPPTVDAAISQRMGLFVVGRLADRHSIRVQLRPSAEGRGTTALVMLPDTVTHRAATEEPDSDTMALVAFVDARFTDGTARADGTWDDEPF
ncbi:nitrate- and nitrite sensing domain-containing protein [Streptomyces sviceus]|uniref:sensor histidine kinase n=1 Tax=Streptomyces sviceus TaxID=285530 RepID=UPI000682B728